MEATATEATSEKTTTPTDAARLQMLPAYPGLWTPWAKVVCLKCHGPELAGGRGQLDPEFWANRDEARYQPTDLRLGGDEDVTTCDDCDRFVFVRSDVAKLHNLVAEAQAHGVDAAMQQTGGMCAAATFPIGGGTLVVTSMDDAGLDVGFYPGNQWETGEMDDDGSPMLEVRDPDEILAIVLSGAEEKPITVAEIRAICARELGKPADYPFFSADYRDDETADAALLRLFAEERAADKTRTDEGIVLVLCHG